MKSVLFLAFLLLPFAALAQSETCPRVWRSGDSLLTDPAPAIQWLRDGQAIPGANERWFQPTEAGSYAVETSSAPSPAYAYRQGYALAGYVFDELHRPIEGASVRKGRFAAATDEKGRFSLWIDERKPEATAPVVLVVEKDGHWRNASRQFVSAFETTETRIMLHTMRVTNRVDATKGGEMAYQGFTLQLTPYAVQTESGTPYSGTILLSVEGSTPSNPDFGLRMPGGSFDAIDESGNDVMLYSYGYLSAEMTTESGEKLELRPEARATLRFYLPWTETHRPDSVPLWHFNESTAVWEQEGWSVRNGSIYEGEVSHFSSWNCDIPADRGTCKGRVIDCNDEPVKGGWVRVGQRNVFADSLGNYWTFVPGGITFDTWAAIDTLREITIPATEERTLEDLTGRDFGGVAVWNPVTQVLSTYMSGNVPESLRLSIDGGSSWTEEREFTGISAAPSEVRVEGGCTERLRVVVRGRQEDCRNPSAEDMYLLPWDSAILSQNVVYGLQLESSNLISGSEGWELLHFPCLAYLHMYGDSLASMPTCVFNLGNLRNLVFRNSGMSRLSEGIGMLGRLEGLEITWTALRSLPESIGNLSHLQRLDVSTNRLTDLPESIGNLNQLKWLEINANYLINMPECIASLSELQGLGLYGNRLTTLPEWLGNLRQLRSLDLAYNRLTSLPESISNLSQLESLRLSYNQLTTLPHWIGNFSQLRSLELSSIPLSNLPEWIENFSQLENLYLSRNGLVSLPEWIGNLEKLRLLQLDNNQLRALPDGIGELEGLRTLNIGNNQLTDLPASIANLADTLQSLYLGGNPIPVERRAAIQAMLPNTTITW